MLFIITAIAPRLYSGNGVTCSIVTSHDGLSNTLARAPPVFRINREGLLHEVATKFGEWLDPNVMESKVMHTLVQGEGIRSR